MKSVILLVTTAPPASEPADTWPEKDAEVPLRDGQGVEHRLEQGQGDHLCWDGIGDVCRGGRADRPEIVFAEMLLNVPAPDIVQYLER